MQKAKSARGKKRLAAKWMLPITKDSTLVASIFAKDQRLFGRPAKRA